MDAYLHNNLKPKKQEQDEHPLIHRGAMRPERSRTRWPVMVGPVPAWASADIVYVWRVPVTVRLRAEAKTES